MKDPQDSSLHQRVEQLESTVVELQHLLRQLQQTLEEQGISGRVNQVSPDPASLPVPPHPQAVPATSQIPITPSRPRFDLLRDGEFWLNRIGIGLLLSGVAFLFKYSVDQGWLTPLVRVEFGLLLGGLLLFTGLRVQGPRRPFSQVLLGGSIATWYITSFAAFQLYALVSYGVAFGLMTLVTLLAFGLSVRQQQAVLSVIGVAGGLGTPFLLDTGQGSLVGLVVYTCLILGGTSAIYWVQGWRSLLWTAFVGGWLIFGIAYTEGISGGARWVLQSGILFGWLVFWALPVSRDLVWMRNLGQGPAATSTPPDSSHTPNLRNTHTHLMTLLTPLIVVGLSKLIWPSDHTWGWITIGAALLYGLIAGYLRRWTASRQLAYTHILVAFSLLAIALVLLLEGNLLFLALAVEGAVLHFIADRLGERPLVIAAHILFGIVGLWFAARLFEPVRGWVVFNPRAITDLSAISLGLVASTRQRQQGQTYRFLIHLAFLGWLWQQLSVLPDGNVFVTMAWGFYGAALLVMGLRRDLAGLRIVGLGTLLLVVAKLLLVDLTEVKAIWRILLFLSFGGLFLFLSYYFRVLWKPASRPPRRPD